MSVLIDDQLNRLVELVELGRPGGCARTGHTTTAATRSTLHRPGGCRGGEVFSCAVS